MDSPSRRLYGSVAWLWFPYPCHRYVLWSLQFCLTLILFPAPTQPNSVKTQANLSFIASGLYYLSELVEEHTVIARKILTRLIYAIIAVQALLTLIDRFPLLLSLGSIASHGVYMGNLRHFPIVKLTDTVFILSCGKLTLPFCAPLLSHPPVQVLPTDNQ